MIITIRRRTLFWLTLVGLGVGFVAGAARIAGARQSEDDRQAAAADIASQVVKAWLKLDYREAPDEWLARLRPYSTEAGKAWFAQQAVSLFPQLVDLNYVAVEVIVDAATIVEPIPTDFGLTGYTVAVTARVRAAGKGLSSDEFSVPNSYKLVVVETDGAWLFQGPAPETGSQ